MYLPNNTFLQGGKYKIIRYINSGGFGCTYEAVHTMLHKKIAIKEYFPKSYCNREENSLQVTIGITSKTETVEKLKNKFIEEAQSLCTLEHPNIVHVFDVFEENGTAYYVMDYIDGKSLKNLIKEKGAMSEHVAVEYIKQVAKALKYVHSKKRLHLDIKPDNIMVNKEGKAMLIDFGVSKQYDFDSEDNGSTLVGSTPGYAPPEQISKDVSKFLPATDIYALGATLYKLLTGITPPSASLLASGETLGELPSAISISTRNAIIQSMQTNKMKRPQSIDEFLILFDSSEDESTIIEEDMDNTIVDDGSTSTGTNAWQMEEARRQREFKAKAERESKEREEAKRKAEEIVLKKGNNKKKAIKITAILAVLVLIVFAFLFFIDQAEPDVVLPTYYEVTNQNYEHKGESVSYSGEVKDGIPHGKGIGIYPHGKYEGDYMEGARHGNGIFTDKEGGVFTGTFANDEYYDGKYVMKDGTYYQGTFKNQQPYKGVWYGKNGTVIGNVNDGVFSEPKAANKKTTVTKQQSDEKEYVPYQQIRKERYKSKHVNVTYE